MQENNEILLKLLREMKIQTHFEKKDRVVTLTLMQLQDLFIKLLELEGSVK